LDKPEGPTSHDLVVQVRRLSGQRRVGHAGTLDPMASGLLPLVLGRATRLVRFLPHSPKIYEGVFRLGMTTTTDDVTGDLLSRHDGALPPADVVLEAAGRFLGRISQLPPAVSARKVAGERMYRLARRGEPVKGRPAEVEVHRFDLSPGEAPGEWRFVAEVSAGTYIRALVRDLGLEVGTGGALAALRRTAIGRLDVARGIRLSMDETATDRLREAILPVDEIPLVPPPVVVADAEAARRFVSGTPVEAPAGAPEEGDCRVVGSDGTLLGIGTAGAGKIRPRVVLPPPGPALPG
jgi:tRNA pseudouridine55 synthase